MLKEFEGELKRNKVLDEIARSFKKKVRESELLLFDLKDIQKIYS